MTLSTNTPNLEWFKRGSVHQNCVHERGGGSRCTSYMRILNILYLCWFCDGGWWKWEPRWTRSSFLRRMLVCLEHDGGSSHHCAPSQVLLLLLLLLLPILLLHLKQDWDVAHLHAGTPPRHQVVFPHPLPLPLEGGEVIEEAVACGQRKPPVQSIHPWSIVWIHGHCVAGHSGSSQIQFWCFSPAAGVVYQNKRNLGKTSQVSLFVAMCLARAAESDCRLLLPVSNIGCPLTSMAGLPWPTIGKSLPHNPISTHLCRCICFGKEVQLKIF